MKCNPRILSAFAAMASFTVVALISLKASLVGTRMVASEVLLILSHSLVFFWR